MTPRLLAALTVLALVLGLGGRARAEDEATKQSRHHYQKAEKLFALGRFDEALDQYEKAYELKPLPKMLFNIAQCHRNLGNLEQAIFSYRKYLRLVPDADNREDVEATIDELEEKQEREAEAKRREAARLPGPEVGKGPKSEHKPIYARWWFWGGVAAVAGASAGGYFLLRDDGIPSTDLGNVVFD